MDFICIFKNDRILILGLRRKRPVPLFKYPKSLFSGNWNYMFLSLNKVTCHLVPCKENFFSLLISFMQMPSSFSTARNIKTALDWTQKIPDLKPIDNMWSIAKRKTPDPKIQNIVMVILIFSSWGNFRHSLTEKTVMLMAYIHRLFVGKPIVL